MPAIEANGQDALDDLVTMSGVAVEIGRVFRGDAQLTLHGSPVEELLDLPVREVLRGVYRQVGTSFVAGTTVAANH
jgi:acetoacetate decarboxylase